MIFAERFGDAVLDAADDQTVEAVDRTFGDPFDHVADDVDLIGDERIVVQVVGVGRIAEFQAEIIGVGIEPGAEEALQYRVIFLHILAERRFVAAHPAGDAQRRQRDVLGVILERRVGKIGLGGGAERRHRPLPPVAVGVAQTVHVHALFGQVVPGQHPRAVLVEEELARGFRRELPFGTVFGLAGRVEFPQEHFERRLQELAEFRPEILRQLVKEFDVLLDRSLVVLDRSDLRAVEFFDVFFQPGGFFRSLRIMHRFDDHVAQQHHRGTEADHQDQRQRAILFDEAIHFITLRYLWIGFLSLIRNSKPVRLISG